MQIQNPWNFDPQALRLTQQQRKQISAFAIQVVLDRISKGQDVSDGPAAPYSPRGPVYLPMTGPKSKFFKGRERGSLKGRFSVSRANASRRGAEASAREGESWLKAMLAGLPDPTPAHVSDRVRGGMSRKFPNYAAMKEFLSHPGYRDLSLSGKMLGSVTETENDETHVAIGFAREEEERIMEKQMTISPQWGYSPRDIELITEFYESLVSENAKTMGFQAA